MDSPKVTPVVREIGRGGGGGAPNLCSCPETSQAREGQQSVTGQSGLPTVLKETPIAK